ncbi:hypothetical protein DEI82_13935 [Curtobacterium sp. MCBD17_019]|nr:hypothetical protein DEI82_13935 [Curtobacterium sp. MCBD17_019]
MCPPTRGSARCGAAPGPGSVTRRKRAERASEEDHAVPVDLDLRLLRAFVVLVAEQGFTAAAAVTGVSQPALSQAIRRLEDVLGVELVDRRGRTPGSGVRLTPAGHAFHVDAVAVLAAAERAVARARRVAARPRVVVGFGTSAPRALTGLAVREGEAADVEVVLEHVPWGSEHQRLAAGEVDVLVAQLSPGFAEADWVATVLGTRDLVAVFRADHPLAGRTALALADLDDEPIVDAASDRDFWIAAARPDGRAPVVVGPPARTVEEMLAQVAAGRGMAFTSTTVAENAGGTGLAFVRMVGLPAVTVAMVRRRDDDRAHVLDLVERVRRSWADPAA